MSEYDNLVILTLSINFANFNRFKTKTKLLRALNFNSILENHQEKEQNTYSENFCYNNF